MDEPRVARPDEETVGPAPIRVVLGGREKALPPLSIRANREWKRRIAAATGSAWVEFGKADDTGRIEGLLTGLIDDMLDLLVAYDETGALGGREWIETHATDPEVYAAFKEVVCVAYPPFRDVRDVPGLFQALIGLTSSVLQERMSSSPTSGGTSPDESTPS